MRTKKWHIQFDTLPSTFEGLCRTFPPRPVHDEIDLRNASEMIEAMAGHRLNRDQEDYLEVLSGLVGAYEDAHYHKDLSHITPADALRYLAQQNGLTASALGEILGNRSLGSKVLRGQRELSKEHIRRLSKRFKVNPALFLG